MAPQRPLAPYHSAAMPSSGLAVVTLDGRDRYLGPGRWRRKSRQRRESGKQGTTTRGRRDADGTGQPSGLPRTVSPSQNERQPRTSSAYLASTIHYKKTCELKVVGYRYQVPMANALLALFQVGQCPAEAHNPGRPRATRGPGTRLSNSLLAAQCPELSDDRYRLRDREDTPWTPANSDKHSGWRLKGRHRNPRLVRSGELMALRYRWFDSDHPDSRAEVVWLSLISRLRVRVPSSGTNRT